VEIKGKAALVTGASSGIGKETARILSAKGARVALVARSREKLEELSRSLPSSIALAADISKPMEARRAVAEAATHFGRLDILVNCAGQGYDAPVEKTDLETLRYIYDLYVVGPLAAMQEAIPIMRRQGGGAIVNVSSGLALGLFPNMGGYSSTKRALGAISLVAREELKKDGITVGLVYPYVTETEFERNTVKHGVPAAEGKLPFPPDSAQFAAQKVVQAVETGEAEVLAHDWMKRMASQGQTG
jgi:short-subunit dehydrogenase